jgi:hypothetical protein
MKRKEEPRAYEEYKLKRDWIDDRGRAYKKGARIKKVNDGKSWQIEGDKGWDSSSWLSPAFVINEKWCEPSEPEKEMVLEIIKTNDILKLDIGDKLPVIYKGTAYENRDNYVYVCFRTEFLFPKNEQPNIYIISMFENLVAIPCDYLIRAGYAKYI